jgi:hypothetical protein
MIRSDKTTPSFTSPKIANTTILGEESGAGCGHPLQNAFLSILGRVGWGWIYWTNRPDHGYYEKYLISWNN